MAQHGGEDCVVAGGTSHGLAEVLGLGGGPGYGGQLEEVLRKRVVVVLQRTYWHSCEEGKGGDYVGKGRGKYATTEIVLRRGFCGGDLSLVVSSLLLQSEVQPSLIRVVGLTGGVVVDQDDVGRDPVVRGWR